MRPLETGAWIFGTGTLAALAIAVTSKNGKTKSMLYNIATGTGISAITMYLADLTDKQHEATAAATAHPSVALPITYPFPTPGSPPAALPGAGLPPGPPPATPPPLPAPSSTPPPAAPPIQPTVPSGANAIGCTPLSGTLPPSAVAQARALLALNPTAADARNRPSLLTIDVMRRLANNLRGCGSDLGFQPVRDALVKDLEDAATRFEVALAGVRPATGQALANVLRFA